MATDKLDSLGLIRKHLEADGGDIARQLLQTFVEKLMNAEVDSLCGAEYGERSDDRTNRRNGYRERDWDTRAGTIALNIPKLREGSYFPAWFLEPRKRAEKALAAVISESYVKGVSTRRVDGLVKSMGLEGISKSQVSRIASELDDVVESFRSRPLDAGPYPYIWVDALVRKCREGGRIVNVATVVATSVNADGQREVLGLDVFTTEDGAGWLSFLRGLVARGLSGVRLIVSDAHEGLKKAIASVFPGASWQRCRTHFMRNLLTRVPKHSQDMVATLVRSVFMQPDAAAVESQFLRVVEQLESTQFRDAAKMLVQAQGEILAFAPFPKEHWRQIWSNNPQERLNKEIRRRTDVVGIFPNRAALIRLAGALLAEQHDEWAVARRYMSADSLTRSTAVNVNDAEEVKELCA